MKPLISNGYKVFVRSNLCTAFGSRGRVMLKNKIKYMLLLAFSFLLACGEDKQSIKPIDTSSLDLKESLSLISTPVNSSWLLAINTSVNNEKITWLLHESGYLWFWSIYERTMFRCCTSSWN